MKLIDFKTKLLDMGITLHPYKLNQSINGNNIIIDIEVDKNRQIVLHCTVNVHKESNNNTIKISGDPELFLKSLDAILKL